MKDKIYTEQEAFKLTAESKSRLQLAAKRVEKSLGQGVSFGVAVLLRVAADEVVNAILAEERRSYLPFKVIFPEENAPSVFKKTRATG